jgi:hypothetical protein
MPALGCHRRVAAAPQFAPRRPNPKGARTLQTMAALRRIWPSSASRGRKWHAISGEGH